MPSANNRHRASLKPMLFPAGLWFVWCCVGLCCCFLFGASRKERQHDPESSKNQTKSDTKGVEHHVSRVSGAPWGGPGPILGPGGPR